MIRVQEYLGGSIVILEPESKKKFGQTYFFNNTIIGKTLIYIFLIITKININANTEIYTQKMTYIAKKKLFPFFLISLYFTKGAAICV